MRLEVFSQSLQQLQIGLPRGIAGVQDQQDQIGLRCRLLRGAELIGTRSGVGIADGVQHLEWRGRALRL